MIIPLTKFDKLSLNPKARAAPAVPKIANKELVGKPRSPNVLIMTIIFNIVFKTERLKLIKVGSIFAFSMVLVAKCVTNLTRYQPTIKKIKAWIPVSKTEVPFVVKY